MFEIEVHDELDELEHEVDDNEETDEIQDFEILFQYEVDEVDELDIEILVENHDEVDDEVDEVFVIKCIYVVEIMCCDDMLYETEIIDDHFFNIDEILHELDEVEQKDLDERLDYHTQIYVIHTD